MRSNLIVNFNRYLFGRFLAYCVIVAYNLVGVATRMAFSIGLNNDVQKHLQQLDAENGKKTWWMLFVQEVELSVDSGRPISVRSCDAQLSYPGVNVLNSESTSPVCYHQFSSGTRG